MNRRLFSSFGIAAVTSGLLASKSSPAQYSPSELEHELPSRLPGPAGGTRLPDLPASPDPRRSEKLLPGFKAQSIKTSGATIYTVTKGGRPPLLLIHGHPETHVTWHKIAPALAERYTVILTDLRGYGDSSKPDASPDNSNYFSRAMGQGKYIERKTFQRR